MHEHEPRRALLAGCDEAAEIAGVSRQRFHFLHRQGRVPEPAARLKCGTVWWAQEIEDWARERPRASGRPTRQRDDMNVVKMGKVCEYEVLVAVKLLVSGPISHADAARIGEERGRQALQGDGELHSYVVHSAGITTVNVSIAK